MHFKILQPVGGDQSIWTHLISQLKPEERDIHFLPEYAIIFKEAFDYQPFLAFFGDEDHFIIQPFVKRPLNQLPFLKEQGISECFYDITNPYGYGGPLCKCKSIGEGQQLFREYSQHLADYCLQNKIITEFTCLHPLLANHHYVGGTDVVETNYEKDIIYFDLRKSQTEIWKEIRHGHQSSIKKAQKSNVQIRKMDLNVSNFNLFKKLYYQTMNRHHASSKWFYPDDYFWNYYCSLGPERVTLFFALMDDIPVSAHLLIHDFDTVYYHYGASDSNYYSYQPTHLLMYEVMLWAKKQRFLRFHLGGGVTSLADDSLFRYKAGFSKERASLFSYHRIFDTEGYLYLSELKKEYEKMIGEYNTSDYFPFYRR